jgi:hypothetical protein
LAKNVIISFKVKSNQGSLACAKESGFSISFDLLYTSFTFAKAAEGLRVAPSKFFQNFGILIYFKVKVVFRRKNLLC